MPKRLDPTDPRECLNRARSSLQHSRSRAEGVYLEELCFDAQQASEKAVKAILVARRVRFPYVHDVAVLLNTLAENGVEVPNEIWQASKLTVYAVEARYPSVGSEVTEAQYSEAVRLAEFVVKWAEGIVCAPFSSPGR